MSWELPSDPRPARQQPYDIVREALIASGIVLVLVLALAAVFSSPDEPPLTIQTFATSRPRAFLQTALGDLDGNGTIASYGPPYNHGTGSVQHAGPFAPQQMAGVTIPIHPATDFVLKPLAAMGKVDPTVAAALARFNRANPAQRTAWEKAYAAALKAARAAHRNTVAAPAAAGPVPDMLGGLLRMAQVGGLDGMLLASHRFYATDYTRPLLFLQGSALGAEAAKLHLVGQQWGMMNETGIYPGAIWLWLYAFWYQIPPFSHSSNADIYVVTIMGTLTGLLIIAPWLPGVNRLPRALRVYRLIWRDWYRS